MKKPDKLYRKSLETFCFFPEKTENSELLWQISNHSSLSIFILFPCGDREKNHKDGGRQMSY